MNIGAPASSLELTGIRRLRRWERAEGRRQEAEGSRQWAVGSRQNAVSSEQELFGKTIDEIT